MKKLEVAAAVIRYKDLIFCAQRPKDKLFAEEWEFPGGKVEKGEDLKKALSRELNEELNLNIEVGDYLMTVNHTYTDKDFDLNMHVYFCDIDTKDISLNEHLDSKWLKVEELNNVNWTEADVPVVNKLKEILK